MRSSPRELPESSNINKNTEITKINKKHQDQQNYQKIRGQGIYKGKPRNIKKHQKQPKNEPKTPKSPKLTKNTRISKTVKKSGDKAFIRLNHEI